MKPGRLRAFTLTEILVSLAVSSVVLLMAAYGFRTVSDISLKVREGLTKNESAYLLMVDVERLFLTSSEPQKRFNEIDFGDVTYHFGHNLTIRKQKGKLDTFSGYLTEPGIGNTVFRKQEGLPVDSLSFTFHDSRFVIMRPSSISSTVNSLIEHGTH